MNITQNLKNKTALFVAALIILATSLISCTKNSSDTAWEIYDRNKKAMDSLYDGVPRIPGIDSNTKVFNR